MMEDPWQQLENLMTVPQSHAGSSSQAEATGNADSERISDNQDFNDSSEGENSE